MLEVIHVIFVVVLGTFAVIDLRKRTLSVPMLLGAVSILSILSIYMSDVTMGERLLGAGVGALLMVISKVTKGAFGMADAWIFVMIGIGYGVADSLVILSYALLMVAMVSIILLMFHKIKRKDSLAFIPFIFLSYMGVLLS